MNLGFGMPISAFAPAIETQPQKRGWQSRLYDKFMPQGEGLLAVDDSDKKAMVRQGLLSLAAGIQSSRNFGEGLTQGLQGGLLAMNQGADNIADRRMKQRYMAQQMHGGSAFLALDAQARAAGYEPGSDGYKNFMKRENGEIARASSAGAQSFEMADENGVPTRYTFNPRTGTYEKAMIGAAPAMQSASGSFSIDPSLPANVQAAIRSNESAWAQAPDQSSVRLPPVQARPIVGRRKEEEEAAVEAAKQGVQLQYLPEQKRIETAAAIEQARGKAEAEALVKREADLATAAQKKFVDANTTLSLLDEAEGLLDQSTGSRVGAARDATAAVFGHSTEGAQAIAALQPIAASLTLAVPRMEGPQSDADRLLYQKAAGDFANPNVPVETRKAAMAQMRRLATKYKQAGGMLPAGDTQAAPRRLKYNPKTGRIE